MDHSLSQVLKQVTVGSETNCIFYTLILHMECMKIYTLLGFFMHVEASILCLLQNRKKYIYLVSSNLESARIILEIMKFIRLLIFVFKYILKYTFIYLKCESS